MRKLSLLLIFLLILLSFVNAQTVAPTPTPKTVEIDWPKKPVKEPETAEEFYQAARWVSWNDSNEIEAIKLLDMAVSMKSDFAEAYYLRGRLKFELQRYKSAIEDFDIVIQQVPRAINTLQQRAEAKIELKDFSGALMDLDMSVGLLAADGMIQYNAFEKRGKLKYLLKDYNGAIEDFTIAAKRTSDQALFYRALTYYKKGEIESAIKDFKFLKDYYFTVSQSARQKYPDQYRENQEYPFGENPLATLVKQPPAKNRVELVGGFGGAGGTGTSVKKSDCPDCKEKRFAVFNDKINPDGWFYSGELTFLPPSVALGDAEVILYFLGSLLEQKNDFDGAIEEYTNSIIAKQYSDGQIRYRRGRLLLKKGEFERAVKDLSWTISETRSAAAYLDRGIAIFMLGHDALAQKDFDIFLKLSPDGKQLLNARMEEATKRRAELKKQTPQEKR